MSTKTAELTDQVLGGGRYQVKAKLSEGGMGLVYRAWDGERKCDVVVKTPQQDMLETPEFARRFAEEIRALVQLSHPHIVKVIDAGEHEGLPFAVMQFLPGGSLRDQQSQGPDGKGVPLAPGKIHSWLPAVASALDFIHQKGFVHRDVKPENILFDGAGKAYLSDFGVAKVLAERPAAQPNGGNGDGFMLGTPQYLAPESIAGGSADGRADQYSLATVVFEMLSGRYPFEGPNAAAILEQHTNKAAPSLASVCSGIAAEVAAAVARALAKKPEERFANCTEFAKAVLKAIPQEKSPRPAPTQKATGAPAAAAVQVSCPSCKKTFKVPAGSEGKKFRCPACKAAIEVPAAAAMPSIKTPKMAKPKTLAAQAPAVATPAPIPFAADTPPAAPTQEEVAAQATPAAETPAGKTPAPAPADGETKAPAKTGFPGNLTGKQKVLLGVGIAAAAIAAPIGLFFLFGDPDVKLPPIASAPQSPRPRSSDTGKTTAKATSAETGKTTSKATAAETGKTTDKKPVDPKRDPPVGAGVFALKDVPETLILRPDKEEMLVVQLDRSGGYQGAVELSLPDLPYSVLSSAKTISVSPEEDKAQFRLMLNPKVTKSDKTTIRVAAKGGKITRFHRIDVQLDIPLKNAKKPTIQLDAVPDVVLKPKESKSITVTVRRLQGYKGAVSLRLDGLSKRFQVKPEKQTIIPEEEQAVFAISGVGEPGFDTVRLIGVGEDEPKPEHVLVIRMGIVEPLVPLKVFQGHDKKEVTALAVSPDGARILTGGADNTIVLWDVQSGKQVWKAEDHVKPVRCLAFSRNGKLILSGSDDSTVRLWDADVGKVKQKFVGTKGPITLVFFDPKGAVCSVGEDQKMTVWNVRSGKPSGEPTAFASPGPVATTVRSKDDLFAATGLRSAEVTFWRWAAERYQRGKKFDLPDATVIRAGAFSADNSVFLYGAGAAMGLWDVRNWREVPGFFPNGAEVWAVAFMPNNNNQIISACRDGTIRLWKRPPYDPDS